ncbi:MAG: hypothetical protein IPH06_06185 [Alphaproteobacteria bacterium]|jgi:hypothetical protein|nr:hypothetical protein [Alphaproteobacteria bacterium]QQS57608.1 MAG: hypothetical protein IPN28_01950 [Alphaproteobacteria bacterium]
MVFVTMRKYFKKPVLLILFVIFLCTAPVTVKKAEAICCGCCSCLTDVVFPDDLIAWIENWININIHIFIELTLHRIFFMDWEFWQENLLPAMMAMAEQLAAVAMQQMTILGAFIDAQEQLETQRLFQQLMAKAHKDYHPSIEMCEFGTRIKSLAATERRGELAAYALSQRSQDRNLGNANVAAFGGPRSDIKSRVNQYLSTYCDRRDNNDALGLICTTGAGAAQRERYNKDIDFPRTIAHPWTINVNLTNFGAATPHEEDIFALAQNLYAFDTYDRPNAKTLENNPTREVNGAQQAYLDMRSRVAQLSVAESSYNAIVGLKAEGTGGSRTFIEAFLQNLGLAAADATALLGNNPSYDAQMEILTKKAYQDPRFYTNLYDKPANVERKGAAIQAIGLIQKFDLFKSYLRTEASLSILLELAVEDLQNEIEDAIDDIHTASE